MVNDPMHGAADHLADVVSMYLEGRADQDELREACIAYYAAHEKRLFEQDVKGMLDNVKSSGTYGPIYVCQGGTTRCDDCRCGLSTPTGLPTKNHIPRRWTRDEIEQIAQQALTANMRRG